MGNKKPKTTVTVKKLTGLKELQWACSMTRRPGMGSNATLAEMYQCMHSPIRTQLFRIEIQNLPTFVSVHHVRHRSACGDFVQSNRIDRGGSGEEGRDTPVQHGSMKNAEDLITMAQARLCYASSSETVSMMIKIRNAVKLVDPDLVDKMVPRCVFKNGLCSELRMCKVGLENVIKMYPQWPGHRMD